jgi:hypothetical protein
MNKVNQRFGKSKRAAHTAQSQRFAAHLLLPQPHQNIIDKN